MKRWSGLCIGMDAEEMVRDLVYGAPPAFISSDRKKYAKDQSG
jgi:hypothetical protein